jgi:hypothetical protein
MRQLVFSQCCQQGITHMTEQNASSEPQVLTEAEIEQVAGGTGYIRAF